MSSQQVIPFSEEEAKNYSEIAKYQITPKNSFIRCIDGRYLPNEETPAFAVPGGAAGYFMLIYAVLNDLGVNLRSSRVAEIVTELLGGVSKICCHTDSHDHSLYQGPAAGCGHFLLSHKDPAKYGLNEDQVKLISFEMGQLFNKGANEVVLQGNHAEQAVLLVRSDNWSILPSVEKGGVKKEVFVLHETFHRNNLKKLTGLFLKEFESNSITKSPDEIEQSVNGWATRQLLATAGAVASNLPIFAIEFVPGSAGGDFHCIPIQTVDFRE